MRQHEASGQGDLLSWNPPQSTSAVDPRSESVTHTVTLRTPPAQTPPYPPSSKCGGREEVRSLVREGALRGPHPGGVGLEGQTAADPQVRHGAEVRESECGDLPRLRTGSAADASDQAHSRPEPRPYQRDAIAAVEREWAAGVKRTLLVMPTGTGKTVVFAELAAHERERAGRTLVIAHRTELLEQAMRKLAAVGCSASLEQGGSRGSRRSDVVVASVQTMRGARLAGWPRDSFTKLVVDEAHHSAATSYQNILEHFSAAQVLGVTATAKRADGRALGRVFDSVAYTYELRQAIRDGWLAPLRARRVHVADMDLTAVRSHHGDFDQGELAAILLAEKALHGVVSPLVQLGGNRKTLVFGVDVAHAKALAAVLNRHKPASAVALDGTATKAERSAARKLFARGAFQYLVGCSLFTEGYDEPSIECVALARPTQSWGLAVQMIGRGTRLHPGKDHCLILDFVGNTKHPLIGPVDALAGADGEFDDEVRADLDKQLAGGQVELEEVLVHAEAFAQQKRERIGLIALTHFRVTEVNPYVGAYMKPLDPNSPAAKQPASEAQLAAMKKLGYSDPPVGLCKGEASQLIDAAIARDKAGLASLAQIRLLKKLNVDVANTTKQRASQLIAIARARGFRPYVFAHEPEFIRGGKR